MPSTDWAALAAGAGVVLRPERTADRDFMLRLFADVRRAEMALVPWPEEAKQRFLADQFRLQDHHYRSLYGDGEFLVIEFAGQPIGRVYLHWGRREIRVVDISLLAAHRGRGIGAALLRAVLAEADSSARPVGLHVTLDNPARRLYERLGFVALGMENGIHIRMNRPPPAPAHRRQSRCETTIP